jgi:hypothetical protein
MVKLVMRHDLIDRFWSRVDKTGDCWLWTYCKNTCGYGVFGVGTGKHVLAHRAAWTYTNGDIPKGLSVLHKCDNPICVRPAHLFLGTQRDNVRDMWRKGRNARMALHARRGIKHYRARLTPEIVAAARERYAGGGISQSSLATEFGVSQTAISKAIRGANWAHV